MGRRLTFNRLIVYLSLVFWTGLWGPVGAFLAVLLLIVALVVVDHLFPEHEPELPVQRTGVPRAAGLDTKDNATSPIPRWTFQH